MAPEQQPTDLAEAALWMEQDCRTRALEHTVAARRWVRWNHLLGIPAIVLTTTAGAAILATERYQLLKGLVALAGAVLTAVVTFLATGRVAEQHAQAEREFSSLWTRFWHLAVVARNLDPSELNGLFTKLVDRRAEIESHSPRVPMWARKEVQNQKAQEREAKASWRTRIRRILKRPSPPT